MVVTTTPQEILANLTELRDGLNDGTIIRNDAIREQNEMLGDLLTALEVARDDQAAEGNKETAQSIDTILENAQRMQREIAEHLARLVH